MNNENNIEKIDESLSQIFGEQLNKDDEMILKILKEQINL